MSHRHPSRGVRERPSGFGHAIQLAEACARPRKRRSGLLYECRIAEPQDYARKLGMEFLHPDYRFLNDAELAKYEKAGVKTSPWTVDEDDDIRYLLGQENIFAIMSNKPDRVLAMRDGR